MNSENKVRSKVENNTLTKDSIEDVEADFTLGIEDEDENSFSKQTTKEEKQRLSGAQEG